MTDISGNVEAMSGYTIGATAGDTITAAEYTIFLGWASAKVSEDGISSTWTNQATSLLICHYIAVKLGYAGKTSETIGAYSYVMATKWTNAQYSTNWLDLYNALRKTSGTTYVVKVNG